MKELDKIIRKKLQNADSPYPADMWQSIHRQLPQKKKRPFLLWFLATIFLVTIGILAFVWNYNGALSGNSKMALHNIPSDNSTNKVESQSQDGISNNENVLPFAHQSTSTQSQNEATSGIQSGMNENTTKVTMKENEQEKLRLSDNVLTIDRQGGDLPAASTLVQANTTTTALSMMESAMSEENRLPIATEQMQKLRREKTEMSTLVVKNKELRIFGVDQSASMEDIGKSMKKHVALQCPTFVKKQNHSFVEFYFSSDFAIRKLKLHSGDNASYVNLRNNTEKPYLSYSAGARFGIGWDNGLYLKSGVDYTRINEKFTYTDPNSIQKKTITILKYIYDNNFNIIDSVKTFEEIEIPGSNTIVHQNAYVFVDLPILFQFSIPGKRRLSYSASVGPYINLAFSQYGKILDIDAKSMLDLQNSNLYRSNIGLSLYASFAINYQLTKNIQIVFEPNVRFMPNSLTTINSTLEQRYLLANVAAGVKYKI